MHEASPKIQAYYQFYETVIVNSPAGRKVARKEEGASISMGGQGYVCESWVEWRGKGFCNVEELRRDMEAALGQGQGSDVKEDRRR
jgi:UDP-glucose:glycoprotein glucosyltransferase